jgi:hypothetical protein
MFLLIIALFPFPGKLLRARTKSQSFCTFQELSEGLLTHGSSTIRPMDSLTILEDE